MNEGFFNEAAGGTGWFERNGTKKWYRNGVLHREDGPAVEYVEGSKEWYRNGVLDRENGPAVELSDGSKYWYLDGKCKGEFHPLPR